MKKSGALLLLVTGIAQAIFAGGGQQAGGPVTLTFWTHEDPNRTRLEERYIAEFQAANPKSSGRPSHRPR